MDKQVVENITVDHENIASVLMGYNINTGWRFQPNVSISIPYSAWLTFTQMYKHLRPLASDTSVSAYYQELATVQFNEVLRSIDMQEEGTLILPGNLNETKYNFDDYVDEFSKLNLPSNEQLLGTLQSKVLQYYRLMDRDIFVPTSVRIKGMSDWNKKLLTVAISYLLLDNKLYSIERR